jgi:hypothetical protein
MRWGSRGRSGFGARRYRDELPLRLAQGEVSLRVVNAGSAPGRQMGIGKRDVLVIRTFKLQDWVISARVNIMEKR